MIKRKGESAKKLSFPWSLGHPPSLHRIKQMNTVTPAQQNICSPHLATPIGIGSSALKRNQDCANGLTPALLCFSRPANEGRKCEDGLRVVLFPPHHRRVKSRRMWRSLNEDYLYIPELCSCFVILKPNFLIFNFLFFFWLCLIHLLNIVLELSRFPLNAWYSSLLLSSSSFPLPYGCIYFANYAGALPF